MTFTEGGDMLKGGNCVSRSHGKGREEDEAFGLGEDPAVPSRM